MKRGTLAGGVFFLITAIILTVVIFSLFLFLDKLGISAKWQYFIILIAVYSVVVVQISVSTKTYKKSLSKIISLIVLITIIVLTILVAFLLIYFKDIKLPNRWFILWVIFPILAILNIYFFVYIHKIINKVLHKKAIEKYKQAIRVNPNLAETHYSLGISYEELKMFKEATASFNQAIIINPNFADAYFELGISYGQLGFITEAVENIKHAIKLNPDFEKTLNEYEVLKKLNPQAAEELFKIIDD